MYLVYDDIIDSLLQSFSLEFAISNTNIYACRYIVKIYVKV